MYTLHELGPTAGSDVTDNECSKIEFKTYSLIYYYDFNNKNMPFLFSRNAMSRSCIRMG